ncbi:MAG TPA: cysteine desulfurase [Trueperaceae bacterium]|nr:cysteine desulfurase [Trueperaceae bacterium]
MPAIDVVSVRRDFPVLSREVNGVPLVYLDSAASSQKPRQVVEALADYYYHHHSNVHRGAHQLSVEATDLYEAARRKVAGFIGAPTSDSLIFTRNATEAINLVAASWGRANLTPGDEIVLTYAEHHANLVPWQLVASERGAVIKPVGLTAEHRVDMDALAAAITPRTKLVTTFHMSNVLGAINPVRRLADMAHAVGAVVLVDGAQGAAHLPVDVSELGCDFYAFSGHKMLGPTGVGALWAAAELLEVMPPFLAGGEMIARVTIEGSTFAPIPKRFEAGTPAIAEAIALAAAVDYLTAIGMDEVRRHDVELTAYAIDRLDAVEGVTLFGPRGADRGSVVAFNLSGVHAHDVASALDAQGVAVRAGQHCAQPLAAWLGVPATVRASFYLYNTMEEVDSLVRAVEVTSAHFGQVT